MLEILTFIGLTTASQDFVLIPLLLNLANLGPKKYTIVSGYAGDEKNFHPGGRKFIILIDFPEISSFLP